MKLQIKAFDVRKNLKKPYTVARLEPWLFCLLTTEPRRKGKFCM
jgi:hypothetical protein